MVAAPYRFGRALLPIRRPAPTLGEHHVAVLGALGLGGEQLADLAARGIIGTTPVDRPLDR